MIAKTGVNTLAQDYEEAARELAHAEDTLWVFEHLTALWEQGKSVHWVTATIYVLGAYRRNDTGFIHSILALDPQGW